MKNPHLALIHDERIPSEILDQFCCDIEDSLLDFRRQSLPERGPQNSLDAWVLSAIAFIILKPYFDAFLKEAGRDHYNILSNALKKIWNRIFSKDANFRFAILTSSGEVKPEYSFLLSIYAEINNGRKVKLLIREGCSKDEYIETIRAFLNLLESYYFDVPNKGVEIDLDSEKDYWGTHFHRIRPGNGIIACFRSNFLHEK